MGLKCRVKLEPIALPDSCQLCEIRLFGSYDFSHMNLFLKNVLRKDTTPDRLRKFSHRLKLLYLSNYSETKVNSKGTGAVQVAFLPAS